MQKYSFTQQKPIKTMARPVKTGLDYFPLHIDFFDDIRICALAVQYGTKGQLAAIILLVHLYKTGYYLLWDDDTRVRVLKDMPGVTFDELDHIVEELVKWDFFDKELFNQQGVLTSREVQKHFFNATKRRRNNIAQMPFLLAETDNTLQKPTTRQKTAQYSQEKSTKMAMWDSCVQKLSFRQQKRRFSKQSVRKSIIREIR